MRRKRANVPAFLELTRNGVTGFVPAVEYLRLPEYRDQAASLALAHLGQWRARFGNILELLEHEQGQAIVRQIDQIKKELGNEWPELPVEPLS